MQTDDRVSFRLIQDGDGYPPADWEHLWADRTSTGTYLIDSIPFFVRDVSVADEVEVAEERGLHVFQRVLRRSGHTCLRLFIEEPSVLSTVRTSLKRLGCELELSHIPGLLAVDVPPSAKVREIREYLEAARSSGALDMEVASGKL